jgi:hypothetical protein
VDRAIAWWRAVLSVPFASYFLTRDDLARATAATSKPSRHPAPALVKALHAGDLLVTGATVVCEPASTDRPALLEHQDLPWLTVVGVNIPATAPTRVLGLIPVTFILADPLTPAEQARLSARHAQRVAAFEQRVRDGYPTLLRLTAAGGDPGYMLSILVRLAEKRGGAFPTKPMVRFQGPDFEQVITHGPGEHPLAWRRSRSPVMASRLEARTRLTPTSAPPRRGPAEMTPTVAMALLARHLEPTTNRPHWFDIADLFNVFAPQLRSAGQLTREQVRRRVGRIHAHHPVDFERFAQDEDRFHQGLQATQRRAQGRP